MPRLLSLVSEDGKVLVSVIPKESEGADTARLRLFEGLRKKTGMYVVEVDQTTLPGRKKSKNARS